MPKKLILRIIFLLGILSISSIAADTSATAFDNFLNNFLNVGNLLITFGYMGEKFKALANHILWFFLVIQVSIEIGIMAAKGELEVAGIAIAFGRAVIIASIFYFIINHPFTYILTDWLWGGFNQLGNDVAGPFGTFKISQLITEAFNLVSYMLNESQTVDKNSFTGYLLIHLFITVFIIMMIAEYFVNFIKFILMTYINVIVWAFAPFQQTRQWAINGLAALLRLGMVLVMMHIVMAIISPFIVTYIQQAIHLHDDSALVYLILFALLGHTLVTNMDGIIGAVFSGQGVGSSGVGQKIMQVTSPMQHVAAMKNASIGGMGGIGGIKTQTGGHMPSSMGISLGGTNMNNPILSKGLNGMGGVSGSALSKANVASAAKLTGTGTAKGITGLTNSVNNGMSKAVDSSLKKLPTNYKSSMGNK
jgi:hypothetical protein